MSLKTTLSWTFLRSAQISGYMTNYGRRVEQHSFLLLLGQIVVIVKVAESYILGSNLPQFIRLQKQWPRVLKRHYLVDLALDIEIFWTVGPYACHYNLRFIMQSGLCFLIIFSSNHVAKKIE